MVVPGKSSALLVVLCISVLCKAPVNACRFASLVEGANAAEPFNGRHLLEYIPVNDTGKAAALAESARQTMATTESIEQYLATALPINIKELLTPVGNYTDLAVFWGAATQFSQFVPGAILYTIKSIPDMLADARLAVATAWENNVELLTLDKTYATIFRALHINIMPQNTGLALRLAFHDAGTYNPAASQKGGANGSIRWEFDWPSNAGIQRFLWPVIWAAKQELDRVLPTPVSYADLCAIAGAVGVYATHGPLINVGYGRPDVDGPDPFQGVGSNTNEQRDYPIQAIIDEWEYYGYSIEQLAVLSGAHSIGFSASTNPQGAISSNDRRFGNKYYKQVILGDAFFGSDRGLADNNATLAVVEDLAANNELFFQKFSQHYLNLTWFGVDPSVKRLGM